jgi:hypothetical protein
MNHGGNPTLWCGARRFAPGALAASTDELTAASCIDCLQAKADHHREQAAAAMARICEVCA